jgi:hypothetical protein
MLRVGTKTLEFQVVCARGEHTLNERQFNILMGVFSGCSADYWEFVSPATFTGFFFSSEKGRGHAQDLYITITQLKKMMPEYESVHAGRAEGPLKATFTWTGKLRSSPQGPALETALQAACASST